MNIFDRPTTKELLDAIIDSLDEEINSENFSNDKTLKFKIIFNVLGIVKREIKLSKKISEKLIERGSNLIKEKNFSIKKISEKIRNNEIHSEDQTLINFLYDLTEEKIKVDNPKYLEKWKKDFY